MTRVLRCLALLLSLTLALPAMAARNYQDMWWLPSESGWGVMVLQQGDIISAVMFHYRADGKPAWYLLSSAPRAAGDVFTGSLYEVTGPSLFSVFNPAAVLPRNVGSMSLRFSSSNAASLTYSIDGQSSTRPIERISFAALDVDGRYIGAQTGIVQCVGNMQVGSYVFPADINVEAGAIRSTTVSNSLLNTGDVSCDWSNSEFSQNGSMIRGLGTMSCRNASSAIVSVAQFEVEQMRIVDHAITINYRATVQYPSASSTCTERGVMSGTRLLNPN